MVVVYNADSLAEHGRIAGVERLLAVSRNDGRLALANRDQSIQVWDVDSRSTIVTMAGHGDRVISGDFSPDGKYLATTALSGSIKFWSTETGQLVLDVNHGLRLPHIVFGSDQCAYATDIEILSREPELDYQHHLVPLLETHSQDGLRLANETLFSRDEGK